MTHALRPAYLLVLVITLSSCSSMRHAGVAATENTPASRVQQLLPRPSSVTLAPSGTFTIQSNTVIAASPGAEPAGRYLAALLRPATGFDLQVQSGTGSAGSIQLRLTPDNATLGPEGYNLVVSSAGVSIMAKEPAGLFYGVQTLRQLLPPTIEADTRQAGPWQVAAVQITDQPRFAWRGTHFDVARHFFGVADIKHLIDLLALHKMNRLHLHLSDDQGWRIEIKSWPRLATHGGSTGVGGKNPGYYTQEDYAEIVRYAGERFITIVPEIDLPGHTNAALASYAELNCDNKARELYTGIEVGFSSVCVESETTYKFVDDVVRELAALTPTPYIHIGGDEVKTLTPAQYNGFIERVQGIVKSHGKTTVGWDEIAHSTLQPGTLVQLWAGNESGQLAVQKGASLIMSPASRIYLDMKYDSTTTLGMNWAGYNDVRDAYDWDPARLLQGVTEANVTGVEAALWAETILSRQDFEYMYFPRLAGVAEIGWSSANRTWDEYRVRLGAQAPRWNQLQINYYRAPEIPWAR